MIKLKFYSATAATQLWWDVNVRTGFQHRCRGTAASVIFVPQRKQTMLQGLRRLTLQPLCLLVWQQFCRHCDQYRLGVKKLDQLVHRQLATHCLTVQSIVPAFTVIISADSGSIYRPRRWRPQCAADPSVVNVVNLEKTKVTLSLSYNSSNE